MNAKAGVVGQRNEKGWSPPLLLPFFPFSFSHGDGGKDDLAGSGHPARLRPSGLLLLVVTTSPLP